MPNSNSLRNSSLSFFIAATHSGVMSSLAVLANASGQALYTVSNISLLIAAANPRTDIPMAIKRGKKTRLLK